MLRDVVAGFQRTPKRRIFDLPQVDPLTTRLPAPFGLCKLRPSGIELLRYYLRHKSDDTAYLQQRKGEKQSPISEKEDSFQENRVVGDRYRGNSFWWYHKNPKGDQCENNLQS